MPFGFFKKKKQLPQRHYDPTNITIRDLRKGFVLDYDMQTWEVVAEYEYDWGNETFSHEYKLKSASDAVFLSVEDEDELALSLSRKLNFSRLDESGAIEDAIHGKGKPPKSVDWEGRTYYRDSESKGYWKEVGAAGESEPFVSWDYYDESGQYILTIEQWDDDEFEAAVGQVAAESAFSNILPLDSDAA